MDGDRRAFSERALADDDVDEMAERLGFCVDGTPVKGAALRAWGIEPEKMERLGELRVLAADGALRILHLRGDGPWKCVREVMMSVDRRAPEATVLWWWSSGDRWTAAIVDCDRNGRRRGKKLVLERDYPDEVGLMQWWSLSPRQCIDDPASAGAEVWQRHFSDVLDQEGITRRFFRRFSAGLDDLIETMKAGPEDDEMRHEIALVTLLRVVFLYFLQARGALDGDRRFVMRKFRDSSRAKSFYRAVLRPLFFGALNCPAEHREQSAKALGELPFLNGGLFEPTAAEQEHPNLDWNDEIWRELLEELFERHRFAVEWSAGDDLCRAVDPEMLGKVFEGLMYGDRRRSSGAFYTPRDVVRSMVRDTFASWFADRAELEESAAERLVDGRAETLTADERRRSREAMANLSVLDPAVGTGAFLLEVLRLLRRVDGALDDAEGVVRTPGESYDRMRMLVHEHLCGVDIQPTAVRLCELRIWLAMLAALPRLPARKMPPLPNLSHRLCTGNSLIEPLDWVRFSADDEANFIGRKTGRFEQKSVERLAVLQRAYTRAHGEEKIELKRSLREAKKEVERRLLNSRKRRLDERIRPLEALGDSADLFGASDQLDGDQKEEKRRLEAERDAVETALEDLEAGRRNQAGFSFDVHFAPAMARDGFDVVVTNPPWVRSRRMDRATRKLVRSRYRSSDHQLWPGASEIGVRAPFGAQVDTAGLFMERSLELLRPGGRLCALVPIKLFRSLHGAGIRGVLGEHDIEYLEDRSEDDRAMFDATTYPSILRVKKRKKPVRRPPTSRVEVGVWRRGGPKRFDQSVDRLCVHGDDAREPWMLVEPQVERIFRTMQKHSVSLGAVDSMPIHRGVMTGCNDVFLMTPEQARDRFSKRIRQEYLNWAIRGRDIGEGAVEPTHQIIWPVDRRGDVVGELPEELEEYFEQHAKRLESRSDYRSGPVWTLFRRHDDIEDPGVVWRDLGEQLEAAVVDERSIPLNTVYYLSTPTRQAAEAVVDLFHSEPMRAVAYAIAERARGGWRRHFAWVMRMLPVPKRWLDAVVGGRADEVRDAASIRCAYGLTTDQVHRLQQWRCGSADRRRLEVA